jgi:hypothetical protein
MSRVTGWRWVGAVALGFVVAAVNAGAGSGVCVAVACLVRP